jgi:YidC/Oxa1 family membrane protein insertase
MARQQNPPGQLQRTLKALAIAILVFYAWTFIVQRFFVKPEAAQTQPAPTSSASAPTANTAPQSAQSAANTRPGGTAGTRTVELTAPTTTSSSDGLTVVGGTDVGDVMLGSASKRNEFPMALALSPRGAAVKQAWLRGYYQTVKSQDPYIIFKPLIVDPATDRQEVYSLETPKIRFPDLGQNGQEARLDSVIWETEQQVSKERVVFSVLIEQADNKALARVKKTYTLRPQPEKTHNVGETHDVLFNVSIENLTGSPLRAVLVQQGPVGFQKEDTQQEDRQVVVAMYDKGGEGSRPVVKGHYRSELIDKGLIELGRDEEGRRIAWVAEANQFFTCIMAAHGRTGVGDAIRFERADAVRLTEHKEADYSDDLSFRFVTAPMTIEPGKSQNVTFDTYIGPKSKTIFQTVDAYKARYYYDVIAVNFYSCAPTALVSMMMSLLNAFHRIPPYNYGIAIFLLVVLVRLILHPITKKSQVNMMKMQKQMATLQPKIQAIKEKYANDRTMLNQETMKVYKEAGVNPAGSVLSCIPMMLQIPIWAALWQALRSTVEMRHAGLDGWWIKDLSRPDAILQLPESMHFTIPLVGIPIVVINLLPILLAITQLLQAKYMPRSTAAAANSGNPDTMEQQRKMMMFMSIFFLFMFYNMPSGLNFYIMCSNIAGILEQKRIRQHIAEEEKKGTFAKTEKKSGLFGWLFGWLQNKWEGLQKEAEDAKRIQSDRGKKKS